MRRMIFIFGILDLGIVITSAGQIPGYVRGLDAQAWLSVACLAVMASLVISGYGLLRGRGWALVLNYVQFPFRVALAFLSFGWVAKLVAPDNSPVVFHEAVWVSAVAIEGVRLGLTIMVQVSDRHRLVDHLLLKSGGFPA